MSVGSSSSLQVAFAKIGIDLRSADVFRLPKEEVGEIVIPEDDWGSMLAISFLAHIFGQPPSNPFDYIRSQYTVRFCCC